MVFTDVNNTYVRVKESDKKIFYIKKADAKKTFVKGDFISIIGENGSELYKAAWDVIDVYDDETSTYVVQNTQTRSSAEETLIAVHNAFFFRDGVGIDIEQLSNVDGEPGDGYILVYDSASKNWVVTAVEFNTSDASDLSSNITGLQRGRLQLVGNQLKFNDASGVQHTINLPTTTSTGGVTAVEVEVRNGDTSTINLGTPVTFNGTQGSSNLLVIPADASDPTAMAAGGIMKETVSANGTGACVIIGTVSDLNTLSTANGGIVYTSNGNNPEEGDDLFVRPGGGLTTVKPTAESHLLQKIGAVESVNANQGQIVVLGAGRTNDVPNLADGEVFIGTASSGTESRQLIADDIDDSTSTNKFFTNALARAAIQAAANSTITFDQSTGNIDIDDSGYLTQVTASDILAAISEGNGISISAQGVIGVRLASGSDLSFNSNGELDVTASVGAASDLSDYDTLALAADQEFTSTITFNIPDKNGTKRSFGRYLHNDTIPINTGATGVPGSMTVKEVLQSAFSEPTTPTPSTPTTTSEIEFNQTTGISVVLNLDFGIQNAGSTGSGELFYRLQSTDGWTSLKDDFTPSFGNDTATYTHTITGTVAYNSANKFQYYIQTTDGGLSDDSGILTVGYENFDLPSITNKTITRESSTSTSSDAGAYLRERGDVHSTIQFRARRNAPYVDLDKIFLQVKIGSTWETIPSTELDVSSTTHNSYTSYTSFTLPATGAITTSAGSRNVSDYPAIEFRGRCTSASPATSVGSGTFTTIQTRFAYYVLFDALDASPSSEIDTIIGNLGTDNNGAFKYGVTTSSFPGALNYSGSQTPAFDNTGTSKYLYLIYPGTSSDISQILLDGVESIYNATSFPSQDYTYQNAFGKSATYTVYRSNAAGSFDDQYLVIS